MPKWAQPLVAVLGLLAIVVLMLLAGPWLLELSLIYSGWVRKVMK